MPLDLSFSNQQHFGSVLILGRSGWGKTWTVNQIIQQWNRNIPETVLHLYPDNYTSWNKWYDATVSVTNGHSIFARVFKQTETIVIEDVQNYFTWQTSNRLKFLDQIKTISKHSNIIITMDPFGTKIPKVWADKNTWNHIVRLSPPSVSDRIAFCKQDPFLKTLTLNQQSFIIETMRDISFRSLQRISHFLQQTHLDGKPITFTILRQSTMQIGEIYLPSGLFSNAQEFVHNPKLTLQELSKFYLEDPFHFPYLIWNTLPNISQYAGRSLPLMLDNYIELLDSLIELDNVSQDNRMVAFAKMHYLFHKGWNIVSSVVFPIPNIRNKISYRKVRKKLLQKVVDSANIPPMFIMERCREDSSLESHIPSTLKNKL